MTFRYGITKRVLTSNGHSLEVSLFLYILCYVILLSGLYAFSSNQSSPFFGLGLEVRANIQDSTTSVDFPNADSCSTQ